MKTRPLSLVLLFASLVVWLGWHASAHATSVGSASVGPVGVGAQSSGYVREWLRLERKGGLYVAFPSDGPVKMVTMRAASLTEASLIFRWAKRADGKISLLFVEPGEIASRLNRATIYVHSIPGGWELYEQDGGTWTRRTRQPVEIREIEDTDGLSYLDAFTVNGLGKFWLVPAEPSTKDRASVTNVLPSSNPLLNGNPGRAASNWIWPALFFAAAFLAAKRRHRFETMQRP